MSVLRHLLVGAVAVAVGAGAMQYALAATPDPVPPAAHARTTQTPAPEPDQRVELPAEPAPEAEPAVPSCDGASDCTEVTGRVVYVESVDPDGDGDLHVVVFDGRSISAPGLTSIDIAPDLRPGTDPRVGQRVAAAGPVQTGSYGQPQVHALDFTVL